MGIQLLLMFQ